MDREWIVYMSVDYGSTLQIRGNNAKTETLPWS